MRSRENKPAFRAVVDLGLRDVGVKNEPRRHALQLGKSGVLSVALIVPAVFVTCAVIGLAGGGVWVLAPLVLVWTVGIVALAFRAVKRAPMTVVTVTADGTNQTTRLLIVHFAVLSVGMAILAGPLALPLVALAVIAAVGAWRTRGYVPEVLRELRALLGPDEQVLGDGVGRAPGARRWQEAFRLIVATDRRLLVVPSPRGSEPFPIVDVPYEDVSRFGMDWNYWGQAGTLSLTIGGLAGAPPETHQITSITPANLVSIAQALRAHGVQPDDPETLPEAEHAWMEAKSDGRSRTRRVLDRAAMSTPDFDRGVWLLLALGALVFYANPFGIGLGASRSAELATIAIVALCALCGFVSRTTSSLAYLVPLNLLVAPAFFFFDALYVVVLMLILSALAAVALWVGAALRGALAGSSDSASKSPMASAARGSLRYTLSGRGLVRLSSIMLAGIATLVMTATAAGFELTSLRLALEEASYEQVPVDGRSNLTGGSASLTYTPEPDLREFVTDKVTAAPGNDGARWELRSPFTQGYNVVSLAHYLFDPRLDNPQAVADFVEKKDEEHERLAGESVSHTERVVDGRKGYFWDHDSPRGFWYYAAWFPHPTHTVRLECIARDEAERFRRLCDQALRSLRFR